MRDRIAQVICVVILNLVMLCTSVYGGDHTSVTKITHLSPRFSYSPYYGQMLGRAVDIERLQGIPYLGQELLFGYQTSTEDGIYTALNSPYYGFGLHYGMYEGGTVKDIFSGFFFFDIPLWRNAKTSINAAAAMGLALHCNQYAFADDPDFMAQSSYANVYSHISLSYHYQLSQELDLGLGARFQHLSNGGWQYPNHGMEMASVQLSVSYTVPSIVLEKNVSHISDKTAEFVPVVSLGVSGSESNYEDTYLYTNFSLAYSFLRRPFYALGVGFDLTYNAALEEQVSSDFHRSDAVYGGFFVSNELLFRKVRLGLQVGTHMFDQVTFSVPVYERLVLRYNYLSNSFLHFGIKLNGGKSECLEWGIGFVI